MTELINKYGWFEYEWSDDRSHPLTIRNFKSNQTLTIKSSQDIEGYGDDKLFVATYSDDDISQPLKFQIKRNEPFWGKPSEHFNIYLNYSDCYLGIPSYGYWRRIDDFIYDSLLCWQVLKISRVIITGGWHADKWSTQLQRTYLVINGIRYSEENKVNVIPYLHSLDSDTPTAWQFVDAIDTPETEVETEAELAYEIYENSLIRYLPKDKPVKGFQGKVPYLESTDGKAYFFLTEVSHSIHPYSDCEVTTAYYTYVDEDIFFTFRSLYSSECELGGSVKNYGFRTYPPPKKLWFRDDHGVINPMKQEKDKKYVYLSYVVWLKIKHSFCDAWAEWNKCKHRLRMHRRFKYREKTSDFKWDEPYGGNAYIAGGFVAGMHQELKIKYNFSEDN